MATLLLSAAGSAIGGLLGPTGAVLGKALGALAGGVIDRALFGPGGTTEVGRLADLSVQGSTEGAPVPRVFGRVRIAGEVIWATRFEERSRTESAGAKGGGPKVRTYSYFANFAVGLCEGPIARVGRVWANGKPLDLTRVTMRVHDGDEAQDTDSLILARQGAAPAYRGLAYVVFEALPLEAFGNALPQLSFEVIKPVGRLERMIRGVTLIPGATEFGYATTEVTAEVASASFAHGNRHAAVAATDVEAALDELQAVAPNLSGVAVVVTWFGDDLRAGACRLRPKVERKDRRTRGLTWSVAGLDRASAEAVGTVDGRPAFGGTPDDRAVVELIRALKARGLAVTIYPFVMMDVPAGNTLPNPAGGIGQPAYPWRGRITTSLAPGVAGSPDGTAAAADEIAAFVGTAAPGDFTARSTSVDYAGPREWTLRRMILHYAHLAKLAGGVDTFLVGSEFRGLSTVRGPARGYPFVTALRGLAADVKAVLGPATSVGYAADWTEYFGDHRDGGRDVAFHLDPLWSDPHVDFVGIDAYFPLADWREGPHADAARAEGPRDRQALAANVAGGEGFDWFYASDADRAAGRRTAITDGAAGKPWVFRFKDLAGWWGNPHHDRIGGVEAATPTGWRPGLKPIRFTEIGCPAVDCGANEPNVFPDRVSSEGRAPRFSRGTRDDAMQRRYLEALLGWFDPAAPGFAAPRNPVSPIDGRRMVDVAKTHVWTWDARPYPWFPLAEDVWVDGRNWATGHWLNGRLGAAPLDDTVAALAAAAGGGVIDTEGVSAVVDGLVVAGRASLRDVLEPLAAPFRFILRETPQGLALLDRPRRRALTIARADLAVEDDRPVTEIRRRQEEDLPGEVAIGFFDTETDGREARVAARRAGPPRVLDLSLPVFQAGAVMQGAADGLIRDLDAGRESASFALPPTLPAPEPGDVIDLVLPERTLVLAIERVEDGAARRVEARSLDPADVVRAAPSWPRPIAPPLAPVTAPPLAVLMDLPTRDGADAHRPWVAATVSPWPGPMAVHLGGTGGFEPVAILEAPAVIGDLASPLPPGRVWRVDEAGTVDVLLARGTLASIGTDAFLEGGNLAAVGSMVGGFELIQFRTATLVGPRLYRLGGLVRGQGGTEARAVAATPAGSRFVLLDGAARRLPIGVERIGRALTLRIGPADRPVDDAGVTELVATPTGAGLVPLAPVHLTARRDPATGDVTIGWIRRTRIGGDAFEAAEVPLGEAVEAYAVTIHGAAGPVRTITTGAPAARYAAAEQAADFGTPPAVLDIAVRQISDVMGPGRETRRMLHV